MSMKSSTPIQIYLFFFISCLLCGTLRAQHSDFFPLAIGNEWNFIGTGCEQGQKSKIRITDTTNIHNTKYFVLNNSVYIRKDSTGNIFKYDSLGDRKWWDFTLPDNETYPFVDYLPWGKKPDTFFVTITTETITVPAGTFLCRQLFFDVKNIYDEEYRRYFAEGVGMVKEDFFGPSEHGALLTYAIIDGKIIGTVGVNTVHLNNGEKPTFNKTRKTGKNLILLHKEDFSRVFPVEQYDLLGRKILFSTANKPAALRIVINIRKP